MDFQLTEQKTKRIAHFSVIPHDGMVLTTSRNNAIGLEWRYPSDLVPAAPTPQNVTILQTPEATTTFDMTEKLIDGLTPHLTPNSNPRALLSIDKAQVVFQFSDILGESISTELIIPNFIPSSFAPKMTTSNTFSVIFNGVTQTGVVRIDTEGNFKIFPDHSCQPNSWNSAGLKGCDGSVLIWIVTR